MRTGKKNIIILVFSTGKYSNITGKNYKTYRQKTLTQNACNAPI